VAAQDDDESNGSTTKTGRFTVAHRGGARVEFGQPIHVGGEKPWLCAVKLMGKNGQNPDADATQTLLIRSGRGSTPEEAQRAAMAQITVVYGSPVEPPPQTKIVRLASDPPPPTEAPDPFLVPPPEPKKRGFFARLFGRKS
jgi:hypothetical protein